jgi:sortase A
VRTKPYGSWTRENRRKRYYRSKWRPNRSLLVLLGLALVLVSVGVVFADIQKVEEVAPPPKSETMRLTVPSMKRVKNVPVYNAPATDESALHDGALHVEGTGFPWQNEANVYIAGHRLGYPRTKSFLVFWDLNKLRRGQRVVLSDSEGQRYVYRVFERFVVGPDDGSVKDLVPGKNIVSLQTCTLPDYSERLIVRAELVRTLQPPAQQQQQAMADD